MRNGRTTGGRDETGGGVRSVIAAGNREESGRQRSSSSATLMPETRPLRPMAQRRSRRPAIVSVPSLDTRMLKSKLLRQFDRFAPEGDAKGNRAFGERADP